MSSRWTCKLARSWKKILFYSSISRRAVNPSTTNELTRVDNGPTPSTKSRLPTIELPRFLGAFSDWVGFRDLFKSVVHDTMDIASVEKFTYLKAYVGTYDNPRILGFDYLDKILEFSVSSSGLLSAMQSFVNTFSEIHTALSTINIPDLGEFILFRLAARVVDAETLALFEETLNDEPFPSVTQLLSFVKKRIKVLQTTFGPNSKVSSARKSSHSARVVMPISVSNTHPKKYKGERVTQHCPFCESTHSLEKCPKYLKMNVTDRAGFVIGLLGASRKACVVLFAKDTITLRCIPNVILGKEIVLLFSRRCRQVKRQGLLRITSTALSSCVNSHSTYLTVLGTAFVHVRNGNGSIVPLRIMVDSGSQVLAISSAAVTRLNLPVSPYHGSLFGLSQTPLRRPEGCVLLSLSPLHNSSPVLNTKAVVLPHLTSKLPPVPLPSFIRSRVSHLHMADPEFDKPDSMDLILGVDLFPKIFLGGRKLLRTVIWFC
ncbi:hypothetical protein J437_LFUL011750 [Ladona fulva]|uniref:Gag-pol polyprotein n=1 Tax=Ladona fulva TaxID=123851 RepID=A0A8K0P4R0_LADFU|nr:hypothetical protein J437_LFUL011750 [Ladona fulva]